MNNFLFLLVWENKIHYFVHSFSERTVLPSLSPPDTQQIAIQTENKVEKVPLIQYVKFKKLSTVINNL